MFGIPITQRHPPPPTMDGAERELPRYWWRSSLRFWVVEPLLEGNGWRYLTIGESFAELEDERGQWDLHQDPCCQDLFWRNKTTDEWFWRLPD